jgi:hypothetical protein
LPPIADAIAATSFDFAISATRRHFQRQLPTLSPPDTPRRDTLFACYADARCRCCYAAPPQLPPLHFADFADAADFARLRRRRDDALYFRAAAAKRRCTICRQAISLSAAEALFFDADSAGAASAMLGRCAALCRQPRCSRHAFAARFRSFRRCCLRYFRWPLFRHTLSILCCQPFSPLFGFRQRPIFDAAADVFFAASGCRQPSCQLIFAYSLYGFSACCRHDYAFRTSRFSFSPPAHYATAVSLIALFFRDIFAAFAFPP